MTSCGKNSLANERVVLALLALWVPSEPRAPKVPQVLSGWRR
jgi:hypothetical protein